MLSSDLKKDGDASQSMHRKIVTSTLVENQVKVLLLFYFPCKCRQLNCVRASRAVEETNLNIITDCVRMTISSSTTAKCFPTFEWSSIDSWWIAFDGGKVKIENDTKLLLMMVFIEIPSASVRFQTLNFLSANILNISSC